MMFSPAFILCFWVVASLVIAAPQNSQLPSSGQPVISSQPQHYLPKGDVEADSFYCADNQCGSVPAPQITVGKSVTIICSAIVRGCVNKSFHAKIEIDGTSIAEGEIQSPDPECQLGESYPYPSITWDEPINAAWLAGAGNHTIRCIVDNKHEIAEIKEDNNTKTITLTVPLPTSDKIKDIKTKPPIPLPVPRVR
jgi:hypothetical protein